MKSTAIVLACGALALTATSFIEAISMWGPLVVICLYTALMAVWAIAKDSGGSQQAGVSYKKAA